MIMLPIFLIAFSLLIIISVFGSAFGAVASGGSVVYNEKAFQNYAMTQYSAEFGESGDAYEDNLLVVFLTNEEADGYYCIAIVGDNIRSEITDMFGNEYTTFGRTMQDSIDYDDYTYSLSSGLARVMERMTEAVERKGLDSSFYFDESHEDSPESHVTNHGTLSVNEKTIERALIEFTEKTDIPAVIVIDSMETVFGKGFTGDDIFVIIIALIFIALAVYMIVQAVKKNKKKDKEEEEPYNRYAND